MRKQRKKKAPRLPAGIKQDVLVIFTSTTGRAPWHPVKPTEVPDWVKHPDVMARLVAGEEAMKCDEGVAGSNFYRAIKASEINEAFKGDH